MKKEHKYEKVVIVMKENPQIGEIQEKLTGRRIEVVDLEIEMTEKQEYQIEMGVFLPKEFGKMELTKLLLDCGRVTYVRC